MNDAHEGAAHRCLLPNESSRKQPVLSWPFPFFKSTTIRAAFWGTKSGTTLSGSSAFHGKASFFCDWSRSSLLGSLLTAHTHFGRGTKTILHMTTFQLPESCHTHVFILRSVMCGVSTGTRHRPHVRRGYSCSPIFLIFLAPIMACQALVLS